MCRSAGTESDTATVLPACPPTADRRSRCQGAAARSVSTTSRRRPLPGAAWARGDRPAAPGGARLGPCRVGPASATRRTAADAKLGPADRAAERRSPPPTPHRPRVSSIGPASSSASSSASSAASVSGGSGGGAPGWSAPGWGATNCSCCGPAVCRSAACGHPGRARWASTSCAASVASASVTAPRPSSAAAERATLSASHSARADPIPKASAVAQSAAATPSSVDDRTGKALRPRRRDGGRLAEPDAVEIDAGKQAGRTGRAAAPPPSPRRAAPARSARHGAMRTHRARGDDLGQIERPRQAAPPCPERDARPNR